ncbi:response regulator [bacterium]|nr:response regulator [bacterium]
MNIKVLVADCSVSFRNMISFTLKTFGFDVLEAVSGSDAILKAVNFQPQVIIADRNLPKIDGIELTKCLRTLPGFCFTPIILLGSEPIGCEKMDIMRAGATFCLEKGVEPDRYVSAIRRVLD